MGIVSLCDAEILVAPSCVVICSGVQVKDRVVPDCPILAVVLVGDNIVNSQLSRKNLKVQIATVFCLLDYSIDSHYSGLSMVLFC